MSNCKDCNDNICKYFDKQTKICKHKDYFVIKCPYPENRQYFCNEYE